MLAYADGRQDDWAIVRMDKLQSMKRETNKMDLLALAG